MKIQNVIRNIFTKYNKNLRADNMVQSGRSMIEMLGVLAIVGVFSVGGIAGYSKAMEMFKANKIKQQVNQIVYQFIYQMDDWKRSFQSSDGATMEIVKIWDVMGDIPDGMTRQGSWLKDSNNNLYLIHCSYNFSECYIQLNLSREKDSSDTKACMNFLEIANLYGNHITQVQLRDYNSDGEGITHKLRDKDLTLV